MTTISNALRAPAALSPASVMPSTQAVTSQAATLTNPYGQDQFERGATQTISNQDPKPTIDPTKGEGDSHVRLKVSYGAGFNNKAYDANSTETETFSRKFVDSDGKTVWLKPQAADELEQMKSQGDKGLGTAYKFDAQPDSVKEGWGWFGVGSLWGSYVERDNRPERGDGKGKLVQQ
ncbi:MAG: hypothetical protein HYV07_10225 [Deltaproteobacteria bacterium]|nr:hypothetical protein [Deltaproteobacteria bacterium]